jgi:hypothetical protein
MSISGTYGEGMPVLDFFDDSRITDEAVFASNGYPVSRKFLGVQVNSIGAAEVAPVDDIVRIVREEGFYALIDKLNDSELNGCLADDICNWPLHGSGKRIQNLHE